MNATPQETERLVNLLVQADKDLATMMKPILLEFLIGKGKGDPRDAITRATACLGLMVSVFERQGISEHEREQGYAKLLNVIRAIGDLTRGTKFPASSFAALMQDTFQEEEAKPSN